MSPLIKAASSALSKCLGVKPGEAVLTIVDPPQEVIGRAFHQAALELGAVALYLEIPSPENDGQEPPPAVAAAMEQVAVVVIPTHKSLSHTQARKRANQAGARVASLPGITQDAMVRTLVGDYREMARVGSRYVEALTAASAVRVTSPGGTDLTFNITGRQAHLDDGQLTKPGSFGNLPAGEVYLAPLEGSAEGVMVVDGSLAGIGLLTGGVVRVEFREGYPVSVDGGPAAGWIKSLMERYGREAGNLAELGIGLNPQARITGSVLEDEKVLGTIHLALGNNSNFGGLIEVPSHVDGVIVKPTVELDGKTIIQDGKLQL